MTINWPMLILRFVALIGAIVSLILSGFVATTYLGGDNDPIPVVFVSVMFAICGVGLLLIVAVLAP